MKLEKLKNFRHAWLLLYFPIFISWFFLDERFITGNYTPIYCFLDDFIPFFEYFVIPYVLWYPFLGAVTLYLLFKDKDGFCRFMWSLILGLSFCLAFYIVFPNGQDLRPDHFERSNVFTAFVARLYSVDSNLNVLPSMHVYGTVAPTVALLMNREAGKKLWVVISSIIICVLICFSTVFMKQHSILDLFAGVILYIPIYWMIYKKGRHWKLWMWPSKP
jgi:membrane-associated phospholipid phosphatase